ncbi:hypothetical protein ABBQ32_008168 [Trebouxia sp. C0010 RCD-2024]
MAQAALDVYGFELNLSPEEAQARQACEAKQQKRAGKWDSYFKQGTLPPASKLKKYCREGIPPSYRAWVWEEVSGATKLQNEHMNNYYEAMVHQGQATSPSARQVELDLPRTFPSNAWVASAEGQSALRNILLAFSVHKPDVGYCQSMNFVAAMLLLCLDLSEERAFWVMVALIDDNGILYHDMYASDLVGTHVEMRSLEELTFKKLPKLYKHLQAQQCEMSIIATDWFLCLFATTLPSETAARVWDALLNEGPKVLFRVALALLKTSEAVLLKQDNVGLLLREIRQAVTHTHDRDKLMKVAFDGIGSMPMARIENYRQVKQEAVEFEMKRRNARKNLDHALVTSSQDSKVMQVEGISAVADRVRHKYGK